MTVLTKCSYKVLVTGGNGFLGQHIVRLLHEEADFVTHIRVLDLQGYTRKLDYTERKPVESCTGDITDEAFLEGVIKGVDCVVHVASVVDVRIYPDEALLHKVNVVGTEKLLAACVRQNIRSVVYCSSQGVAMGFTDIKDGTESQEAPSDFLLGTYAKSKLLAEQTVLRTDNTALPDGGRMRTIAVRPVLMYGELDVHYVPEYLKSAREVGGTMVNCCGSDVYMQEAYVGNVAWMFLCAIHALKENPDLGGEAFFACDDTPLASLAKKCEPYLHCHGMKLTSFVMPFWVMYVLVTIWTMIIIVIVPLHGIKTKFTRTSIIALNMKVNFTYDKARKLLSYKPRYTDKVSFQRSLEYYKQKHILDRYFKRAD